MKILRATILVVTALLISGTTTPTIAQNPQQLYQQALIKEEGEGALQAAIDLYEQIADNSSADKSLQAKALLHIGMCYEKLGNQEAVKAYQRLVSNFPGQKNEVAIARERLSRLRPITVKVSKTPLTPTPLVPKFTKINMPTFPGNGVLSPDGNEMAFVSDGAIWVIPLHGKVNPDIAGEPFRIIEIPDAWDYGSLMSWSVDGDWIAVNGKQIDDGTEVYVIKATGKESHKVLIPNRGGHPFSYRLSLSPDGQMLAFSALEPGTLQEVQDPHDRRIFTIPVSGGDPKLVSSNGARAQLPSFSPDGKFIAYVGYEKGNIGELWIVPSTGGNPTKLGNVNGRLRGPVWSPDRKYIAAHHEPGNSNFSNEILVYPLSSDLSTTGEPTKITLPGESLNLLAGWTPQDELGVFIQSEQHSAIYTVPASGGKAVQVTPEGDWPYYPRWSPDGKRIYFRPPYLPRKGIDDENKQNSVLYVSAAGGNPVGIPAVKPDLALTSRVPGGGFNISPDGEKIVISTGMEPSKPNEGNLWTISLTDGLPIRLTSDRYFDGRYPCWSSDGKWIAFIDDADTQDKNNKEGFTAIYVIPAEGGKIRQITSKADSVGGGAITFSANGKHIAFFSGGAIKTIPFEGGLSKVLVADIKSGGHSQLAYSPDGSKIAHNDQGKIWITSLNEGKTKELSTGLPKSARLSEFGWSPDGEKIAIFCTMGGETEFWLIKNFLPLDKLSQKNNANFLPPQLTNKKIWEDPDIDDSGEISPNGKYLAYNDWDTGNLAVYEIATGKKRKLTNLNPGQGSDYDQFAFSPRWSGDSRHIYYSVFVSPGLSELRSIGLNDSKSTTICKIEGNEKWLELFDLSNDGNTILATIEIKNIITQIALISVPDGEIRIIKEFPTAPLVENLKFTNDGGNIIYDYPPELDSPNHDIYLLSADGKTEAPIITHPADDCVLGISPEGKELLFASNRSGQLGFWSIGFENGKTHGVPTLIKISEHPYLKGLGFTKSGAFVYCHFPSKTDIYETEFNPATGKIIAPPHEVVKSFVGANSTPDYSSDGKYMAFVSRRSPYNVRQTFRPVGNIISIQSRKDGNVREIRPEISNFGFPKWSPDNRSILVVNWDTKHKMGLYNVDIETGKSNLIYSGETQSFSSHEWSLDGKSVYMVWNDGSGNQKLVLFNIETGKETILTEGTWKELTNISRSADGKWIAFMGRDKNRSIRVIPSAGGEIREIHSWNQGDNRFIFHCWSADGKYIYLSKLREPKIDLIWDIWQIPVDGSEARKMGLELTNIWQISAHPDGKHLAYSNQGSAYKIPEVWMMENFLPRVETVDKKKLNK